MSKYPLDYYEQYFSSWGEVCAAARTTGMSEEPPAFTEQFTLDLTFEKRRFYVF